MPLPSMTLPVKMGFRKVRRLESFEFDSFKIGIFADFPETRNLKSFFR